MWYCISVESKTNKQQKKRDTNEFIYKTKRFTDIQNKLMITKGERARNKLRGWNLNIFATM